MVTEKTNIAFLDGFLRALSMLTDLNLTLVSMTSLNETYELNFLNFYNFLSSDCIHSTIDVNPSDLEKFLKDELFKKASNLGNLAEDKKKYISYKIMDYLEFCFEDVDGRVFDGLEFDRWHITKLKFEYKKIYSYSFIFSSSISNKFLVLTFWNNG